ncbi:hypothetical protein MSZK_36560 [Mycobacterium sp. shizuoka-1]|nr:hypothetical protein MSZK_36560 [Mycobacterium sp. shizuoka-1]
MLTLTSLLIPGGPYGVRSGGLRDAVQRTAHMCDPPNSEIRSATPDADTMPSECHMRRFSGKVELWMQSLRFATAAGW